MIEEFGLEVTALAGSRVAHQVFHQLVHVRLLQKPLSEGNSKTVLLLVEDFLRKNTFHRLLEKIPLLKSLQLERSRDAAREFGQMLVEERVTDVYACEFRCSRNLSEVVVRQCHFDVEIKNAVQFVGSFCPGEMLLRHGEPILPAYFLEKLSRKNLILRMTQEETVGQNATRVRNFRATDILARQTKLAIVQGQHADQRLDQTRAKPGWKEVINRKVFVLLVALVAAEELVAAITRQECVDALLGSEEGAVIRTDCRRIRERLVELRNYFLDRIRSVLRNQEFLKMLRMKGSR